MSISSDRQFREAEAAVERAVTTFMKAIDRMMWRWDYVAGSALLERVLLKPCEELIDGRFSDWAPGAPGPTTLKLSNALADYPDSLWKERG